MLNACLRAKELYEDKRSWNAVIKRDMNEDFSWNNSADLYINMYWEMLKGN